MIEPAYVPGTTRNSHRHRAIVLIVQVFLFILSAIGAFLLRFDLSIPAHYIPHLLYALTIWLCVKTLVFHFAGLDKGWWQFVSAHDVLRIAAVNFAGSVMGGVLIRLIAPTGFPRSIYFLDLLLCLLATTGIRILTRLFVTYMRQDTTGSGKRIVIYGAGEAGVALLREIRAHGGLGYLIRGFVDDNTAKTGAVIQGIRVLGPGANLPKLSLQQELDEVLIALPSASGPQMTRVIRNCQQAGLRCRTIPALTEIIQGKALASQIREVELDDLLGRVPVMLDRQSIAEKLKGTVVMVTGAAGSIGSELCRQIAGFSPGAIIGFEISETGLFHLEREMAETFPEVPFYPEMGSIQNRRRLREVLDRHRPSIVFHAAAYKHVPMLESHVIEAIENNVLGTCEVALASAAAGVSAFVMISTDKAIAPTSIMGATKRIAEAYVSSLRAGAMKCATVRFGNVLGSNGSVIPIFKKQIAAGGPVTITHPDMRRYFMTIPEAAQLVIQASTMGSGGEVFVLDMGEPVKIIDLAKNLIALSGLRPDQDIRIEITGIRPGEKLFEELSAEDETMAPTAHAKIRCLVGKYLSSDRTRAMIEKLRLLCEAGDAQGLVSQIREIVPEYRPTARTGDQADRGMAEELEAPANFG